MKAVHLFGAKTQLGRALLLLILLCAGCASRDIVWDQTVANQPSCEGWNTLEFFQSASVEHINQCLNAGADPNAHDYDGYTPLHWTEDAAVAQLLLNAGAIVHARNRWGETPLHTTFDAGVTRVLLAAGADPEVFNYIYMTPLLVQPGHAGRVRLLLDAGAQPEAHGYLGIRPLHVAAEHNLLGAVEVLLAAGADVNIRDYFQSTPLHFAAADLVERLVRAGAEIDAQTYDGLTPLHVAQDAAKAKALLDVGADLSARNNGELTPLLYSAESGNHLVLKVLVEAGADVNESSEWGHMALHLALRGRHSVAAKALIELGADVNSKDRWGDSPLHVAVESGTTKVPGEAIDQELITLLLLAGANPCARDARDKTPLDRVLGIIQSLEERLTGVRDEEERKVYEELMNRLHQIGSTLEIAASEKTESP